MTTEVASSKDLMGTCKWFDEKKGFGFIRTESIDSDIFIHYKHILCDGYRTLVKNELVIFEPTTTSKGIMAIKCRKITENPGI
jgi:CspA family cold shock protein